MCTQMKVEITKDEKVRMNRNFSSKLWKSTKKGMKLFQEGDRDIGSNQ